MPKLAHKNELHRSCFQSVLELPPGISPALVIGIPGTAVGRGIPVWDAICPRLCHDPIVRLWQGVSKDESEVVLRNKTSSHTVLLE